MKARNEKRSELGQHQKLNIFKTLFENQAFSGFEMKAVRGDNNKLIEFNLKVSHVDLDDIVELTKAVGLSFYMTKIEMDEDYTQMFSVSVS